MSREVVLRIRPGESVDDFTSRIADNAPPITPELASQLRALLVPADEPTAPPRAARAAA